MYYTKEQIPGYNQINVNQALEAINTAHIDRGSPVNNMCPIEEQMVPREPSEMEKIQANLSMMASMGIDPNCGYFEGDALKIWNESTMIGFDNNSPKYTGLPNIPAQTYQPRPTYTPQYTPPVYIPAYNPPLPSFEEILSDDSVPF